MKISVLHRLLLALVFFVVSVLAFCLMLIVMTFEVGLLFSASLGLGLGVFIFRTFFKLP